MSPHKTFVLSPARRTGIFAACIAPIALALTGCNWISLARHTLTYPTLPRGAIGNVATFRNMFVATAGEDGFTVRDSTGAPIVAVRPAPGSESVDDIAIDGDFCFVLDAHAPGHLSVWSLRDPSHPVLLSDVRDVPVGPFSGVSAAAGTVVVSGGTSNLTVWHYATDGTLTGPSDAADLGRGQPDVVLARDGRVAYVSTHRWGPYFELDVLSLAHHRDGMLHAASRLELPGAGFTDGGAKPANFPIVMAPLNSRTLLIAHARGVSVIDVSNPDNAVKSADIDTFGPAVHITSLGNRAAVTVAGSHPAVVVLDFAAHSAPTRTTIPLPPGTNPLGVAMSHVRIAVAARERGLLMLTSSDASHSASASRTRP